MSSYSDVIKLIMEDTMDGIRERLDMNVCIASGTWTRILVGYHLPPADGAWRGFIGEVGLASPQPRVEWTGGPWPGGNTRRMWLVPAGRS